MAATAGIEGYPGIISGGWNNITENKLELVATAAVAYLFFPVAVVYQSYQAFFLEPDIVKDINPDRLNALIVPGTLVGQLRCHQLRDIAMSIAAIAWAIFPLLGLLGGGGMTFPLAVALTFVVLNTVKYIKEEWDISSQYQNTAAGIKVENPSSRGLVGSVLGYLENLQTLLTRLSGGSA